MVARRNFMLGSLAASAAGLSPAGGAIRAAEPDRKTIDRIVALEHGQARLGVCLLDTMTGHAIGNRINERFAMCSAFKLALAAACLLEAEAGRLDLDQIIPFDQTDIVSYSPVIRQAISSGGMSVRELAKATTTTSDNAAANLLIERLGGPARVTTIFRRMGDTVTRLDRYEPMMNLVLSADLRDTTSPLAMARLVSNLTTGNLLSKDHRETLVDWMILTRTGRRRIRAGLPAGWVAGDKTGTGLGAGTTNKYNDVALIFPPDATPIIASVFFDSAERSDRIEPDDEAVLAQIGRIAADWAINR